MQFSTRLATALVSMALSVPAMAAITPIVDAAAFQAALTGGSYTEAFTDVTDAPPASYGNGTFAFQADAAGGLYSASGNDLSTNEADDALTITFTTGNVRGIGGNFFNTDIDGSFDSFFSVGIVMSNGDAFLWEPSSESSFLGFLSDDPIQSITFLPVDGYPITGLTGLYATIDNLTIGNVAQIPEPGSLALVGLAIAGLVARRRRTA